MQAYECSKLNKLVKLVIIPPAKLVRVRTWHVPLYCIDGRSPQFCIHLELFRHQE